MTRAAAPKMQLAFTRGEMKRLHEEIGDLPKSRVGPKLLELYRYLDALLTAEGGKKATSSNSSGGEVVPMRGGGKQ